jgi:hypothetical protein
MYGEKVYGNEEKIKRTSGDTIAGGDQAIYPPERG